LLRQRLLWRDAAAAALAFAEGVDKGGGCIGLLRLRWAAAGAGGAPAPPFAELCVMKRAKKLPASVSLGGWGASGGGGGSGAGPGAALTRSVGPGDLGLGALSHYDVIHNPASLALMFLQYYCLLTNSIPARRPSFAKR